MQWGCYANHRHTLPRRGDSALIRYNEMATSLLFKVEDVFDVPRRGCFIVPAIPEGLDFRMRANDQIELHTPDGQVLETHIASIELLKVQDGPSRMVIMLPREIAKRDVPAGTEVWIDPMNALISKTVAILREFHDLSDDEIYRKTVAAGIEPKHAARLVELLPMAYCRLILAGSGTRFSDMFQRRQHNGSLTHERALASEPLWKEITSFARTEQGRVTGRDLLSIAARSAEFDAANQLLNRGVKPQNIVLSTTVFPWAEEGPTL